VSGAKAAGLALALASAGVPSRAGDAPQAIGLPEALPIEPQVKDPVFAVLLAMVRSGLYGVLTREHLERELARRQLRSRLPYRTVREVARLPETPQDTARVSVRFERPLDVPIPYSILWYHPGRIRGPEACAFHEWRLGDLELPHEAKPGAAVTTLRLGDVHVFGLEAGSLTVDIDGWLDRLLGSGLDDTEVSGLVVFRYEGRSYGMALGYNRSRRARSGAFDFEADRVVFPYPAEMKTVGRLMRGRLEALRREVAPQAAEASDDGRGAGTQVPP
jgi:hypothetical protein